MISSVTSRRELCDALTSTVVLERKPHAIRMSEDSVERTTGQRLACCSLHSRSVTRFVTYDDAGKDEPNQNATIARAAKIRCVRMSVLSRVENKKKRNRKQFGTRTIVSSLTIVDTCIRKPFVLIVAVMLQRHSFRDGVPAPSHLCSQHLEAIVRSNDHHCDGCASNATRQPDPLRSQGCDRSLLRMVQWFILGSLAGKPVLSEMIIRAC